MHLSYWFKNSVSSLVSSCSLNCSAVPYLFQAYFTGTFVQSVTAGIWSTVMVSLCGSALIYLIVLKPIVNLYSLLLYLESPPVEIKDNCTSGFFPLDEPGYRRAI